MHILFVCTGNICRSPTAEALTRGYAESYLDPPDQLTAASVGTRALVGEPMEPTAELALIGLGGNSDNFRARQLDVEHVVEADLVLGMTRHHRKTVLAMSPRALQRTFTLREAGHLLGGVDQASLPGPADLDARGRALVAALARLRATRSEAEPGSDDIFDPIGASTRTFQRVSEEVAEPLLRLLALLCGRVG